MRPLILCGAVAIAGVIVLEIIPRRVEARTLSAAEGDSLRPDQLKIIRESGLSADELNQVASVRGTNWITTLKKVAPVLAAHPPTWPVLLSGIGFLYLWWLSALVFDLAFIWQRYVRNSVSNDRLLEWNPYRFNLRTETGEARANMHAGVES
jgi:hypothetical protein